MQKKNAPPIVRIGLYISLGAWTLSSAFSQPRSAFDESTLQKDASVDINAFSVPTCNPGVLGLSGWPNNQVIVPMLPSVSAGYWSDKLALTPYGNMDFSKKSDIADFINVVLDRSFKTGGIDATQASQKIMNGVGDGASICTQMAITPFFLATKIGAVSMHSYVNAQIDIPRGVFAALFGGNEGLLPGNTLDFKTLSAQAVSYSTISLAHGRQFYTDVPCRVLSRLSKGFFDCDRASWRVGVDYVMGHYFFKERTLDGAMTASTRNGVDGIALNGKVETIISGGGIHGNWEMPGAMTAGDFFPGNGAGFNVGADFAGPRTSLRLSLSNVGFIRWKNVKKAVYALGDSSVTYSRLFSDTILQTKPGNGDSLVNAPAFYQSLPTTATLSGGYIFQVNDSRKWVKALSKYVACTLRYDQHLAPWPTLSYVPDVSLTIENGALFGVVPIRCGFFAGGLGRCGSGLGCGLRTRFVKMDLGYNAFGTPYFFPKRGCTVSASIVETW